MPISQKFQLLLSRIQPSEEQHSARMAQAKQIENCLKNHISLHSTRIIGSHSRGSAIYPYSDIDLMAIFHRKDAVWGGSYVASTTALEWVRKTLISRYPTTEIGKDKQAIVVGFKNGHVDVVPAIFEGMKMVGQINRPMFRIPDGFGDWMKTAPEVHSVYIESAHKLSGYKFTRCLQLLKYWRECRVPKVPLSSFHLELVLASAGVFNQIATYQTCLHEAFKLLLRRECRALQDPMGISGNVKACATEAQRESAQNAIAYAVDKASRALIAEQGGYSKDARDYWNLVFNGHFPG